jgi:hypothetical protein
MSNTVPRNLPLSFGECINGQSLGRHSSQWIETREHTRRIAELFKTTSGSVAEHLWNTRAQEYPGLTRGRKVKRLCDRCGVFRVGHLAPAAK